MTTVEETTESIINLDRVLILSFRSFSSILLYVFSCVVLRLSSSSSSCSAQWCSCQRVTFASSSKASAYPNAVSGENGPEKSSTTMSLCLSPLPICPSRSTRQTLLVLVFEQAAARRGTGTWERACSTGWASSSPRGTSMLLRTDGTLIRPAQASHGHGLKNRRLADPGVFRVWCRVCFCF